MADNGAISQLGLGCLLYPRASPVYTQKCELYTFIYFWHCYLMLLCYTNVSLIIFISHEMNIKVRSILTPRDE